MYGDANLVHSLALKQLAAAVRVQIARRQQSVASASGEEFFQDF